MERMTKKAYNIYDNEFVGYECCNSDDYMRIQKLGELEDVLDKFYIKNAKDLDIVLTELKKECVGFVDRNAMLILEYEKQLHELPNKICDEIRTCPLVVEVEDSLFRPPRRFREVTEQKLLEIQKKYEVGDVKN